jgi:hypothetical protein
MRTECFVKIMKVWLLLAIVIVLLALPRKEGFNPATTRPSRADESIVRTVTAYTGLNATSDTAKVDKYIGALQKFYDDKYLPDKQTPTNEQVTEFIGVQTDPDLDSAKLTSLINYVFLTTPSQQTAAEVSNPATTVPLGNTTSTTTGGSSGIALGPTSGGGGRNVWGPEFVGMGGSGGMGDTDTTGSRNYPVLLGPKPDISTLSPAGIVPPSKSWQLANDGSLPSPSVMGSTEESKFLPSSRVPGDQDLIPDPYRVASAFSTSSYSTKTEPVPFLTDFSAFQK